MPRTPPEPTLLPRDGTLGEYEFDEQSAVFARSVDGESTPESSTGAVSHIDAKILEAEAVIAKLHPDDLHARVLRIAVARRDEVLITGMLRSLEARERARSASVPPAAGRKG